MSISRAKGLNRQILFRFGRSSTGPRATRAAVRSRLQPNG